MFMGWQGSDLDQNSLVVRQILIGIFIEEPKDSL